MAALAGPFTFLSLEKGMRARVVAIHDDCADCRRLQEMGLTIGAEFTVIKVAPMGDPIEVNLRGYRLCIRKQESCCFEIEQA